MSGKRFSFEASLSPEERGVVHRLLKSGAIDADRFRRTSVRVAAGKMGLLKLDDKALSASTDAKLLFVRSSIEGVQYWPIDSPTPEVDPDTRHFGPLLDLDADVFDHDHGAGSLATHVGDPTAVYEELPCFQRVTEDLSAPSDSSWQTFDADNDLPYSLYNQSSENKSILFEANAGVPVWVGSQHRPRFLYLIGMDAYYNLGTKYDDLEVSVAIQVTDPTKCRWMYMAFWCYPFGDDNRYRPEDVPDTNDYGDTIWSTTDRIIDRNRLSPYALGDATVTSPPGSDFGQGNSLASAIMSVVDEEAWFDAMDAGWHNYRFPSKSAFDEGASSPLPGSDWWMRDGSLWNRVTAMSAGIWGRTDTAYDITHIFNVHFGPRPGTLHTLRPHRMTSDQPWATSSVPAIGIYNPTGLTAEVEAFYLGL